MKKLFLLFIGVLAFGASDPTLSPLTSCAPLSYLAGSPHRPFNPLHVTLLYPKEGLSAAETTALKKKLERLGIRVLNTPKPGKPIVAELFGDEKNIVSTWPEIDHLQRQSEWANEKWADGKKKTRPATDKEDREEDDAQKWKDMREPNDLSAVQDIEEIREIARKKGITFVLLGEMPLDAERLRSLENLYGGSIFYADSIPADAGMIRLPGVAMHIGPSPSGLRVRGEVNPLLGYGDLHGTINKIEENRIARKYMPSAMSKGLTAAELNQSPAGKKLAPQKERLGNLIATYLKGDRTSAEPTLERELEKYLTGLFAAIHEEMPAGAFVKWEGDYATRESGGIVTTFGTKPKALAKHYLEILSQFKSESEEPLNLRDQELHRDIANWDTQANAVHSLLTKPSDILVQEKLDIEQTYAGNNLEFRVDVYNGTVVNSSFRFGANEYYPAEAAQAKKFVEKFYAALPKKYQYMSGGFDVVKLKNGKYKIIEFNAGTQSAMIDPEGYAIEASRSLSNFFNQPTPLERRMELLFSSPVEAQVDALRKLPTEREEKTSIHDITKGDMLTWFRDRYARRWQSNPNRYQADKILSELHELVKKAGLTKSEDAEDVEVSLKEYFLRALREQRG